MWTPIWRDNFVNFVRSEKFFSLIVTHTLVGISEDWGSMNVSFQKSGGNHTLNEDNRDKFSTINGLFRLV